MTDFNGRTVFVTGASGGIGDGPTRPRRFDRQRIQPSQPGRAHRAHLLRLLQSGLDDITRVSALELGKYSICVNSVNPTVVMTPMSTGYWGQDHIHGPFLEQMPLGCWATEAEIAAPIVFLLSDGASMITGTSLSIDGGYSNR